MAYFLRSMIFNVIITSILLALFIGTLPSQTANAYDEVKQWQNELLDDPDTTYQHIESSSSNAGKNDEKRNAFNDKLRGLRRLSRIIDSLGFESDFRPAKKSPEVVDELDENGNGGQQIVSSGHIINQNSAVIDDAIPLVADGLRNVASPQGMDGRPLRQINQTPSDQQVGWKLKSRGTTNTDEQKETGVPKRSALGLEAFRKKSRESRRRWGGKASRPQPFRIGLFGKRDAAETLGMINTSDLADVIAGKRKYTDDNDDDKDYNYEDNNNNNNNYVISCTLV